MTDTPPLASQPSRPWRKPHPLIMKAGLLFLLTLVLLVPIQSIQGLIYERQSRQWTVVQEIAGAWGPAQEVIGPFLEVPIKTADGSLQAIKLLPSDLKVTGAITPQTKRRGLYEVLVYDAGLSIAADFAALDSGKLGVARDRLRLAETKLVLLVASLDGMGGELVATLADGQQILFEPEASASGFIALKASLPPLTGGLAQSLRFDLTLAGTQGFSLAPAGRAVTLDLSSPWPHPSFQGGELPRESEISERGFAAQWRMSHVGAQVPIGWVGSTDESDANFAQLRYGAPQVRLIDPVDGYSMSERAIKYAPFVLLLVFAAVFLFETIGKSPLHPVQYALLGCDMALFFLLLLSLTEAISFTPAYLAAAGMTALLAALYLYWSNKKKRQAFGLFATLAAIHAYLYVTLAAEDFALLSGSLALFLLLAVAMLATRKVCWFQSAPATGV